MDFTKLNKLYEEYGKLTIQLELIQNRTNEIKKLIANELNKPKEEQRDSKEQSVPSVV